MLSNQCKILIVQNDKSKSEYLSEIIGDKYEYSVCDCYEKIEGIIKEQKQAVLGILFDFGVEKNVSIKILDYINNNSLKNLFVFIALNDFSEDIVNEVEKYDFCDILFKTDDKRIGLHRIDCMSKLIRKNLVENNKTSFSNRILLELWDVNISKDRCDGQMFSEMIWNFSKKISQTSKREEFVTRFSVESLKEQFANGIQSIVFLCVLINRKNQKSIVQINIKMTSDIETNDILGEITVEDITEEYLDDKLPGLLYEKEYQTVALIDSKNNLISIRKYRDDFGQVIKQYDNAMLDYEITCNNLAATVVTPKDRERFVNNVSIDNVVSKLDQDDSYEFNVYYLSKDRQKRLKKYKYMYFDRENDIILNTVEDLTNFLENDVVINGINRQGFIRKANEYIFDKNDGEKYAILYYNIKGFKAVNELFGTDGGDGVLRYIYNNLCKSTLRPVLVARFEADHFVMLVNQNNLDYEEITKLCSLTYKQDEKTINIFARCGIYLANDYTKKISGMCDRAKLAKEYIKDDFVKPYAIYDRSMKQDYMDKTEILNELSAALDNDQFKVYFQPIFDAKTEKVASAEALIRWEHPERGIVSPAMFVPALEENGHISKIDLFVANSVNKFLESRYVNGKYIVPISVNLSWMDFYNDSMMDSILTDAQNTIINKGYQRYEVTETSYASLTEDNTGILGNLKKSGAKILLDDFGSGYSSFSTIRDYDFDILKIDMGFVKKIGESEKACSIIHSIIDMAHHMNAKVIAEGAETVQQVEFLKRHNCDYIQGFYYSKPLPLREFEKLLDEEN